MFRTGAAIAIAMCLAGHSAAFAVSFRTVVTTGLAAPNEPQVGSFFDLQPPDLDDSGRVAFSALMQSKGYGMWSEGGGSLELLAIEGTQAAGLPEATDYFLLNNWPVLNNAGQTRFSSEPDIVGVGNGQWIFSGGKHLDWVVATGMEPPGGQSFEAITAVVGGSVDGD